MHTMSGIYIGSDWIDLDHWVSTNGLQLEFKAEQETKSSGSTDMAH